MSSKLLETSTYYVLTDISTPQILWLQNYEKNGMSLGLPFIKGGFMNGSTTNILNAISWLYGMETMTFRIRSTV